MSGGGIYYSRSIVGELSFCTNNLNDSFLNGSIIVTIFDRLFMNFGENMTMTRQFSSFNGFSDVRPSELCHHFEMMRMLRTQQQQRPRSSRRGPPSDLVNDGRFQWVLYRISEGIEVRLKPRENQVQSVCLNTIFVYLKSASDKVDSI